MLFNATKNTIMDVKKNMPCNYIKLHFQVKKSTWIQNAFQMKYRDSLSSKVLHSKPGWISSAIREFSTQNPSLGQYELPWRHHKWTGPVFNQSCLASWKNEFTSSFILSSLRLSQRASPITFQSKYCAEEFVSLQERPVPGRRKPAKFMLLCLQSVVTSIQKYLTVQAK